MHILSIGCSVDEFDTLMLKKILFSVFLLMVYHSYSQVNTFQLPQNKDRMTANFDNYDNMVVVEMMLQDSIPVRLIIDSGIEGLIITDTNLVNYFEPHCIRNFKLTAPASTTTLDACITSLVKLKFGALEPIYTNAILLQEDFFSLESYIGAKVHGLIGVDRFRNLVLTINYDKNYLRITRPSVFRIPVKSEVISLDILRGRPYMSARVELDNKEIRDLWLMIDSGANHPLLLETDSTETYEPLASLSTTIGRGLGGNIPGRFVRSGWLLIGNSRLDNIITSISSEYISGNPSSRNFRNGTLGSGALSRFEVSFDFTNKRMILKKGNKFGEPFEYNMSGVTFESLNTGFNIFRVAEVIYDSPAYHAGVHQDDLLISINGKAAFSIDLGELNGLLSHRPGNYVTLIVSRDGKLLTFKFRLKRLI